MWGDLICCWECMKYKPSSGFDTFSHEMEVLEKHRMRIERMEKVETEVYWDLCRRCRVKLLLQFLEGRDVVYEDHYDWDDYPSLGVIRLENDKKKSVWKATTYSWEAWHAWIYNYESWEDIFAALGI